MNYENALGTSGFDDVVQYGRHLSDTERSGITPVIVPHIANNKCGSPRLPGNSFYVRFGIRRVFTLRAKIELEVLSPS
jgi:hypothetical protein